MNQPYELDIDDLNRRWFDAVNIDSWSQLVIKHTDDTVEYVTQAPRSGIYKMMDDGCIYFDRMDTHRRAVEKENEAFFLRITRVGDYLYEGADMGILVMRGRLMTDDFQLKDRARMWIHGIKSLYKSKTPGNEQFVTEKVAEIGGFKMM